MPITAASLLVDVGIQGIDKVTGGLTQADQAVQGFGSRAAGVLGTALIGAAAAGTAAIGAFGVSSVGAAATFEQSLSSIQAVSGATAAEMEQISAVALQLGADTSFSAQEAAAGFEELIKGGLSTADAMAAAKPMLDLAAAGGIGVANAAEIAANAMGIFGLKGSDMTNVANQIAGAANASSLDVSDFQMSMSAAGSVAAGVGQSFDDLATAIAIMGKSGIKGSDAGTSLKTMLMNLQPTTKAQIKLFRDLGITHQDNTKMAAAFAQYGLNPLNASMEDADQQLMKAVTGWDGMKKMTKEQTDTWEAAQQSLGLVTNEFINADGSFKSMSEIAEVLQNSMTGLTDAQRAQALETMFGSDAIRAANIFVKEGAEGFDAMAESMGKVTAESVAATRMDNFKGAIDAMKGSIETFQIVIGTALLPMLSSLVTQYITPAINAATDFATAFFAAGDKLGFLTAAIDGVLPGFAGLVQWLQTAIPAAVAAAANVWSTTLQPALVAIGAVITGTIVPAFTSMVTWLAQNWTLVQQVGTAIAAAVVIFQTLSTVAAIVGTVTTAISGMGAAITAAGGVVGAVVAVLGGPLTIAIGAVALAAGALYLAWQTNFGGIQEKTAAVWSFIQSATEPVIATLSRFASEVAPMMAAAWDNIQSKVSTAWQAISGVITSVAGTIVGFIQSHMSQIQSIIQGVWTVIQGIVQTAWALISGVIKTGLSVLAGDWSGAWNAIKETAAGVWDGIKTVISGAMQVIQAEASIAWDAIKGTAIAAWEAIRSTVAAKIGEVVALAQALPGQIVGALSGLAGQLVSIGAAAIQGLINGLKSIDVGSILGGILNSAISAAKNAIISKSPSKKTRDELGKPMGEGIVVGILSTGQSVKDALSDILTGAIAPFSKGARIPAEAVEAHLRKILNATDTADKGMKIPAEQVEAHLRKILNATTASAKGMKIPAEAVEAHLRKILNATDAADKGMKIPAEQVEAHLRKILNATTASAKGMKIPAEQVEAHLRKILNMVDTTATDLHLTAPTMMEPLTSALAGVPNIILTQGNAVVAAIRLVIGNYNAELTKIQKPDFTGGYIKGPTPLRDLPANDEQYTTPTTPMTPLRYLPPNDERYNAKSGTTVNLTINNPRNVQDVEFGLKRALQSAGLA